MTLDELLECNAAQLEAMSDTQLLEHFKQYLTVTRPELAPKRQAKSSTAYQPVIPLSPQKQAMLAMLASEGVDMGFLNRRKKR